MVSRAVRSIQSRERNPRGVVGVVFPLADHQDDCDTSVNNNVSHTSRERVLETNSRTSRKHRHRNQPWDEREKYSHSLRNSRLETTVATVPERSPSKFFRRLCHTRSGDELSDRVRILYPDETISGYSLLESDNGWNRTDVEVSSDLWERIDVDFDHGSIDSVRNRLHRRLHHLTRPTPVSIKIDEHSILAFENPVEFGFILNFANCSLRFGRFCLVSHI